MTMPRAIIVCAAVFLLASGVFGADVRPVREGLKVEDLGSPASRRMANWKLIYKAPDGAPHLFVPFCAANGFGSDPVSEVLDFNLATGEIVSQPGPKGGTYCRPGWVHPNGKMYSFTTRPVTLLEYDPAAKKLRNVGTLAGFYNTIHDCAKATDGVLFFGHNGRQLTSYDPETDKTGDHGVMGGGTSNTNQFIYTCVADDRYVYCAMANHGQWYLVVYDRQEKKQAEFSKPAKGERSPAKNVFHGADGKLYYTGGGKTWRLEGGKPVEVNVKKIQRGDPSNVFAYSAQIAQSAFGLEVDTDGFTPTNWNNGTVTLKWRKAAAEGKEPEEWRVATHEGLGVVPNCVGRLAVAPDGKAYGFAAFYGPIFEFDTKTGTSAYVGPSPGSVYDLLATKDALYMCGYSHFFAVYDRTKPYAGDPKAARFKDLKANPFKLPGAGKRTFKMLEMADGTIISCGNFSRHDTGAEVTVYDPVTKKITSFREKVKDYVVCDMCLLDKGERALISLVAFDKERPGTTFMIYNCRTKAVEQTLDLDLGWRDDAIVFEAGPQHVIALIQQWDRKAPEDVKGYLSRIDLVAGKALFTKEIKGKVFNGPTQFDFRDIDQRLIVGPDGCGWLFIDKHLSRIHPDGTVQKVMEAQPGMLMWAGEDLFIYPGGRGRFGGFSGVIVIRDVLAAK